MHKKWKSVAALGMAALLGCLMPMGTMLAAEEDTEAVQESEADSVSDTDEGYDGEVNVDENEITGDEGIEVMSEAEDTEAAGNNNASVIDITLNDGVSCKVDGLGGKIDFKYVNHLGERFDVSVSPDDKNVSLYYYLNEVDDITADAKNEEQMASLWPDGSSSPTIFGLSENKNYVLYVKAVGKDGQITYARSCGIVVDTIAPKIVGLEEGKAYPEGTTFEVEEANLDSVLVNEKPVSPDSDGNYQVSANGTSCVIRVKDKAGNEKTCSITVTARTPNANGVISVNGTYALKADIAYQLAEGSWQVSGDGTVYQGGNTFYVKKDGDYRFTKR